MTPKIPKKKRRKSRQQFCLCEWICANRSNDDNKERRAPFPSLAVQINPHNKTKALRRAAYNIVFSADHIGFDSNVVIESIARLKILLKSSVSKRIWINLPARIRFVLYAAFSSWIYLNLLLVKLSVIRQRQKETETGIKKEEIAVKTKNCGVN